MDKELIIDMLEDTKVKNILGIEIELGLYEKDKVKITYMDTDNQLQVMKKEFDNSL